MRSSGSAPALHLQIRIDRDTCIGSGQCVHWAPDTFEQDADAKAVVSDRIGSAEAIVVKAMQSCPVEAITLDVGGVTVGPRDVANWMIGAGADDPVVARLATLADEHEELRELIARRPARSGELAAMITERTADHLRDEDALYAELGDLVEPGLVEAFLAGHARIEKALGELADTTGPEPHPLRVGVALAAIDEQMRLEESVLFPIVLSSIVRRED